MMDFGPAGSLDSTVMTDFSNRVVNLPTGLISSMISDRITQMDIAGAGDYTGVREYITPTEITFSIEAWSEPGCEGPNPIVFPSIYVTPSTSAETYLSNLGVTSKMGQWTTYDSTVHMYSPTEPPTPY